MTVNSTRDFIPPEPFEGQNYKPRYARPLASLREELIFCLRQYGNTEWLVDIKNTSTLTDEKLKIKFSSLKLTRPPDEFVSFDTRPKDFIVVSDNLTTANMDPCNSLNLKGFAPRKEPQVI